MLCHIKDAVELRLAGLQNIAVDSVNKDLCNAWGIKCFYVWLIVISAVLSNTNLFNLYTLNPHKEMWRHACVNDGSGVPNNHAFSCKIANFNQVKKEEKTKWWVMFCITHSKQSN